MHAYEGCDDEGQTLAWNVVSRPCRYGREEFGMTSRDFVGERRMREVGNELLP